MYSAQSLEERVTYFIVSRGKVVAWGMGLHIVKFREV